MRGIFHKWFLKNGQSIIYNEFINGTLNLVKEYTHTHIYTSED